MSCGEETGGERPGPPREPPRTLQGLLEMAQQQWLREALSAALGGAEGSGGALERCLHDLGGPDPPEESLELLAELCGGGCGRGPLACWGPVPRTCRRPRGGPWLWGRCPPCWRHWGGTPTPKCPPAALFAISCLVRGQPSGLTQLERLGGLEALGGALKRPPLRARAAFLVHSLLGEHPPLAEILVGQGWVPRLVELLRTEHGAAHEHAMGALCRLSLSAGGLQACRDPPLGLEQLLRERGAQLRGHQESREELEFCQQLLQRCFPENPPQETPPQETPPQELLPPAIPPPALLPLPGPPPHR
ncbi:hsp70-binding protein 1 [Cuculus canorus]|uniref:hsp70-binding protein 1 n=1 Tax=Cuculus canorus TaxID=55661 RepID=UPI0023AAEE8E|nr:hsp70-binding protein 1 [Cuculus canorus]